jgi:hypothetical protein
MKKGQRTTASPANNYHHSLMHDDTSNTPQFPPLQKQPHTVFTPEQLAEDCGYTNQIGTTVLGDTIDRAYFSADSCFIFDPHCKKYESKRNGQACFEFFDVEPGDRFFPPTGPDARSVGIASLSCAGDLLTALLQSAKPFQFVAAPGTDRETRVRVAAGGAIQRISTAGRRPVAAPTGFSLAISFEARQGNVDLVHKVRGRGMVRWTDEDGQPTGQTSLARFALLSQTSLRFAGDLFDALTALDAEALAAYGQIVGVCAICGRSLKDADSLKRGVGPDCWETIKRREVA